MYISKVYIENYKSFQESEEIALEPGINIIVGPNNSGKTALLEAIGARFNNKPHKRQLVRQADNLWGKANTYNRSTKVKIGIRVTGGQLKTMIPSYPQKVVPSSMDGADVGRAFTQALHDGFTITVPVTDKGIEGKGIDFGLYAQSAQFFELREAQEDVLIEGKFVRKNAGHYVLHGSSMNNVESHAHAILGYDQIKSFLDSIYRFNAERLRVSSCSVGQNAILLPDASNLPEVLQVLSTNNPARFERFNSLVGKIFPSVKWVSATTTQVNESQTALPSLSKTQNNIEIKVWLVEKSTEREDLAIPLSECGTGIGQALAILYVVITSQEPRVIIIDEPQSFLHPGAAKTLIGILKQFPQHQYIVSTHSPEILTSANPATITALRYEEGETKTESLALNQTKELRSVLDSIGVRFGDVFFADDILWVEGQTEEAAYPQIIEKLVSGAADLRMSILPLNNTGDLIRKKQGWRNAKQVFEIYQKLSGAQALAPPMIGVILDREEYTPSERKELRILGDGKIAFLSRRMFENYLLDAEAIAAIANEEEGFSETPLLVDEISAWLNVQAESAKYLPENSRRKNPPSLQDAKTLKEIDGARLLEDLFKHFSERRVAYRKTTHSVELTNWILENKPEQFREVAKLLESILIHQVFPDD